MKDTIPFLNDDEQSDLYELMCEKLKKAVIIIMKYQTFV